MRARSSVVSVSRVASRFTPLILLIAGLASAQIQVPQFDLDRLVVDSSAAGSLVVGTGEILPVGAVRFSLAGDYQNDPYRYFQAGSQVESIISDRYTVHLVGGFAPVDWLEIGLDLPIVAAQQGGLEIQIPGVPEPLRRGLGSPTISARGALFSQAKGSPFDVAFQLGAKLPIGSAGLPFTSDGMISLSPRLMIGRNLEWARAGIELGAHWRPDALNVNDSGDPVIDDIGTSLLIAGVISTGPQTGLRGELSGRTYVNIAGKVGAVEVLAGARYPVAPNMEIYALAGPGLGQSPGTPTWRVMVGAAFGNGQGITGTPMPGQAGAAQPGAGTTPTTPTTPTETAPSDPYPPFTPPPDSYPPQSPYPPGYPQPTSPQPTYPQPTYPQPTYPQPTSPQPTYPQPTYPQPTYPQPTSPQPTYPQPTYPQPSYPPADPGYAPAPTPTYSPPPSPPPAEPKPRQGS